LTLEGGLDPDEYVKQNGADVYRAKLDAAPTYFHWLADRARAKLDMRTAEGRMDALKFLMPAVQKISDKVERAVVIEDIASYLGVEQGIVLDQFKRMAVGRGAAPAAKPQEPPGVPAIERILLLALLRSDRARNEILPLLTPEMTEETATLEILDALRHTTGLAGTAGGFSALESRLSPPNQALLHELLAADDRGDEESSWRDAQIRFRRLQELARKRQLDKLRSSVKAAEREGRVDEALRLTVQLQQLDDEIKRDAGVWAQRTRPKPDGRVV
jgi:DNA primase